MSTLSILEIELQIADQKSALTKLEQTLAKEKLKPPLPADKQLAIDLHKCTCTQNHTDGCGWHYEFNSKTQADDWDGWAHKEYLKKAQVLIKFCDERGVAPVDLLAGYKLIRGY